MTAWVNSVTLGLSTLTALTACFVGSLRRPAVLITGLAAGVLLIWHGFSGHGGPLESHLDGLLLLAALLAGALIFLASSERLPGVLAFGLPVMTLVLAWAWCASTFTFEPFAPLTLTTSVHLLSVYMGTTAFAIAAAAGGVYLVARQRLRPGGEPRVLKRLPSLERTERVIIRSAAVGFALLTVGFVTGLVIIAREGSAAPEGWWRSPKMMLSASVYVIYALVMNARFASRFRGPRAAWMAIAGLVLLLSTFAVVLALPGQASGAGVH